MIQHSLSLNRNIGGNMKTFPVPNQNIIKVYKGMGLILPSFVTWGVDVNGVQLEALAV
jgi:hypothetical protein